MVTRKFGGKTYTWVGMFSTKPLANKFTKDLRSSGFLARVTKAKFTGVGVTVMVYNVWRRRR